MEVNRSRIALIFLFFLIISVSIYIFQFSQFPREYVFKHSTSFSLNAIKPTNTTSNSNFTLISMNELKKNLDEYAISKNLTNAPKLLQSISELPSLSNMDLKYTDTRRKNFNKTKIVREVDDKPDEMDDEKDGPIVHFVYLSRQKHKAFQFRHYLMIRAAYIRIRPRAMYLHVDDVPPSSPAMSLILPMLNRIILWKESQYKYFGNKEINTPEHRTDVIRLQALYKYGGIYMDTDVLTIRSFDPLLKLKPVVLGLENPEGTICNAVIIGRKKAKFLEIWLENYRKNYNPNSWLYNSGKVPFDLGQNDYPNLVSFVSMTRFFWPDSTSKMGKLLFREYHKNNEIYQFDSNYAVHIGNHEFSDHYAGLTPMNILKIRNGVNQIYRTVLPPIFFRFEVAGRPSKDLKKKLAQQTFPLFEIVLEDKKEKQLKCDRFLTFCEKFDLRKDIALWRVRLSWKQLMKMENDFLEKLITKFHQDLDRSFEYSVNGIHIEFVYENTYRQEVLA